MDRMTDGRTERRTDKAGHRVANSRLKIFESGSKRPNGKLLIMFVYFASLVYRGGLEDTG